MKTKNIQNLVYDFINVESRFAIDRKQRWRRKIKDKQLFFIKYKKLIVINTNNKKFLRI